MKIYNEIVFDVDGNVVYEDSYEYSGDVILCQEDDDPFNFNFNLGINLGDITSGVGGSLDFPTLNIDPEAVQTIIEENQQRGLRSQTQGSDIQANAAPSLPSISNVGSIAPTGVVNWNAIPGGFQPLPQTAGGRKKLYQLSKFHGGINQKSSPRDIADFECQEAINVTVSQVGRIKLLGDCLNTNNSITTEDSQKADRGAAGYGLFQFTAPAATNGTAGEYVVTLAPSGDEIDAHDSTGTTDSWITYGVTDDHDVAHVIYAAGNGVYANDANFRTSSDNPRKANIYVYREDAGSSQTVSGWKEGKALIDSPTYDIAAAGSMAAGDVKVVHSAETASVAGTMIVDCTPTGTGTWGAGGATTYYFYCSWLFDGGCETGLTSCGTDDGTGTSDGIAFTDNTLQLNISLMHTPHASNNTELGGDKRIEGGRIYFKESGTAERWLLAEFNLVDGVKGALDSTFTPWTESSDVYSHTTIIFVNPPEVYSYASLNAYYANEAYGESPDINDDDATGPTAHDVRYKTAVVGSGGIVFIGNVKFKGKHMPDSMMFSMPGKPGVFPKFNTFDSPSSDGSPITALAAFKDTILQFKENALYVINVSNPAQFYAQASFRDCGVFNPCQVFTTSFGVIFANQIGCFIYAGGKVISLTSGKFDFTNWDLPSDEGSSIGADGTGVPCVGYDPRSQSIVVLKDINDDSEDTGAFVYNMVTQSWTEGSSMITNANTNRHTNFIITSGGYLSILRDNSTSLLNYNHDMQTGTNSYASAQSIEYITKDLDFGLPSQTKKIFKVYVTYKGDCDGISVYFRADGNSTDRQFNSTNTPLSDVGSTLTTVTLTPTTASQAKDIKSFALKFTGSVGVDASDSFEINDISILYRVRPIK